MYNRKSIVFEHGMCACIGGLDRAHIHIMSISKDVKEKIITKSINKVLFNRKAGIEYINYNNYVHSVTYFAKKGRSKSASAVGLSR